MLIPRRSQKVNVRKEEHPTSTAQKSWKVTSETCIDVENEPKGLNPYIGKELKDAIREQNEQYPQKSRTGRIV